MAVFTKFAAGFDISSPSAVDKRLILTKAEMKEQKFSDNTRFSIPTHTDDISSAGRTYFAICVEDKMIYIYDESVGASPETGHFHPLQSLLDFTEGGTGLETNFENAVKASTVVAELENTVHGTEDKQGLAAQVAEIQKQIDEITMNGGEVT